MSTTTRTEWKKVYYPLMTPQERALVWKKIKGMWKHKKPEPIHQLRKIRAKWERPPIVIDKQIRARYY